MHELGRIMVVIGVIVLVAGGIIWKTGGLFGLGKLPGDIFVQKGSSSFYFPVVTCVVISLLLTLISWLLRK